MGVVVGEGPHEDTDSAAANAVRHDPRILQRLPPQLQDESLLWIDGRRRSGGDTEKLGVELVDGVEKSTPWGRDRPNRGAMSGPAIGDGMTSRSQKPPQLPRPVSSGETARHADDRNFATLGPDIHLEIPLSTFANCVFWATAASARK
jgi:hypothetical protein